MATPDVVRDILNGALGQFWTWDGTTRLKGEATVAGGYADLDDGMLRVQTLMSDYELVSGGLFPSQPDPEALLGVIPAGTVMITGVQSVGSVVRLGPAAASRWIYRSRNVCLGIPDLRRVRSHRMKSVSAEYPGLLTWAGMPRSQVQVKSAPDGRAVSARIDLAGPPTVPAAVVRRGIRLELDSRWRLDEHGEQRTVHTSLVMRCVGTTPQAADDLVRVLDYARLALILAFRGWITATPGEAQLDVPRGTKWDANPRFWSSVLAEHPGAARTASLRDIAFFTLADLGGPAGLARWAQLCEDHRRVIQPLMMFHRNGCSTVEDHLVAICAAAEYLVASKSKDPGWEDVPGAPSGGIAKIYTMAERVGQPWTNFVGDRGKWAHKLWRAYNDTKHYRPTKLDLSSARALAASIEILLTCVLLDTAGKSKKASRSVLNHHTLIPLRDELHSITS